MHKSVNFTSITTVNISQLSHLIAFTIQIQLQNRGVWHAYIQDRKSGLGSNYNVRQPQRETSFAGDSQVT